jgi:glycosyltransferase involved in cell wall biosynthesis
MLFLSGFYHKSEKIKFKKSGIFNKIKYKYLLPADYSNFFIRQFFHRIFPTYFNEKKITAIIKEQEYDIIWLDFGSKVVKLSLNLFKKNLGVKYFHERSEYSWIGLTGRNSLHKKYLQDFLPNIDILSVMTEKLSNYYNDFIGRKTRIIHLPMTVDFSRFQNPIIETQLHRPYIAYCGTMSNAKDGVDILIKSFIRISDAFPELHLYIAGPLIPEQDYLMQKIIITESNAENRITYLGNLQREEMPAFLSNAHVLALARPESKQAEGGFPTKLGEYLATGRPVCITNVGEISNYLKDNESAFIAQPGSIESFVDALTRAISSVDAEKIGEFGKNVALLNFNKEIQAKLLFNYLSTLIK